MDRVSSYRLRQGLIPRYVAGRDPGVDLGEIHPGPATDAFVIPEFDPVIEKHHPVPPRRNPPGLDQLNADLLGKRLSLVLTGGISNLYFEYRKFS